MLKREDRARWTRRRDVTPGGGRVVGDRLLSPDYWLLTPLSARPYGFRRAKMASIWSMIEFIRATRAR